MAIAKKTTKKTAAKTAEKPAVVERMLEPEIKWAKPKPVEKELPPKRLSVLPDGSAEVLLKNGKMLVLSAEMVKAIAQLVK